jgi:hypothetical protein
MQSNHFTRDVLLTQTDPGTFKIAFDGVEYLPTDNPMKMGVLLFGLRPKGIQFQCSEDPGGFLHFATRAGHILHLFANGSRTMPDGMERISRVELLRWIADAVSLAPTPETAAKAEALILENLGPNSGI